MYAFCDASFDDRFKIGVIGFHISVEDHIHTDVVLIRSSTAAELEAVNRCIDYCKVYYANQKLITIYTDQKRLDGKMILPNMKLNYMKGHGERVTVNEISFGLVDKLTRQILRTYIKAF